MHDLATEIDRQRTVVERLCRQPVDAPTTPVDTHACRPFRSQDAAAYQRDFHRVEQLTWRDL